jgi:transcriptional regulatory protein RtcR
MKNVVVGLVGTVLDMRGKGAKRWDQWRPSISVVQQPDFPVDRFELLFDRANSRYAHRTAEDIVFASPNTEVVLKQIDVKDSWDFEDMYGALLDYCLQSSFEPEKESYHLHITTGTHVAQICWFLLCEANYIPAKLLQSSPAPSEGPQGRVQFIDLDLSKYDKLSSRFEHQASDNIQFLKSGIETKNEKFNAMIDQIEHVATRSDAPMLITGPTGAGKSQIAKRIYELKHHKGLLQGDFVNVNCATLRGDGAMSTLFGHTKGAFTGAQTTRQGLLSKAHGGLLFLDEIGELGLDEQAMLLHAIEEKCFYPVGSDKTINSDFQLIAGTNRDLAQRISEGLFREDLLARINLWCYDLPGLSDRREDIAPNIEYELTQLEKKKKQKVSMNRDAKTKFLTFAQSSKATWQGNFRDLNASIIRMGTLAEGGRINERVVTEEIDQLTSRWHSKVVTSASVNLSDFFKTEDLGQLDSFDKQQLEFVIDTCRRSQSLSEAGRQLFDKSRLQKASTNDGHRLRQYLAKFGLKFDELGSS